MRDKMSSCLLFAKVRYFLKKLYIYCDVLFVFYQLIFQIYVDKAVGSGNGNGFVCPVNIVYKLVDYR